MKAKNEYLSPSTIVMDIQTNHFLMASGDDPTPAMQGNVYNTAEDNIIGG